VISTYSTSLTTPIDFLHSSVSRSYFTVIRTECLEVLFADDESVSVKRAFYCLLIINDQPSKKDPSQKNLSSLLKEEYKYTFIVIANYQIQNHQNQSSTMDTQVENFYRKILTDLTVSEEDATELVEFFSSVNPPPDKLVWLRATAFKIGCEFLSDDDNKDHDVALLRAINVIVHCLEKTCMVPKLPDGNSEYDAEKVEGFLSTLYEDTAVDQEENQTLLDFFKENIPPTDSLVTMRAAAFKVGCDALKEGDKDANVDLLRCINVVVHNFELTCFKYVRNGICIVSYVF
jgi:hypothetical protein